MTLEKLLTITRIAILISFAITLCSLLFLVVLFRFGRCESGVFPQYEEVMGAVMAGAFLLVFAAGAHLRMLTNRDMFDEFKLEYENNYYAINIAYDIVPINLRNLIFDVPILSTAGAAISCAGILLYFIGLKTSSCSLL